MIIREGYSAEDDIKFMTDTIIAYFSEFIDKYKKKSFRFNYIFEPYTSRPFIKKALLFIKKNKFSANIIFNTEDAFRYDYQTNRTNFNGTFDNKTFDINIYLNRTGRDIIKIRKTLSHELKHLYDAVSSNNFDFVEKEKDIYYYDKPSEIGARITGFINSYDNWDSDLKVIYKDAKSAIGTSSLVWDKKLAKILYKIKSIGLKKYVVVPPIIEKKKSKLELVIDELVKRDIKYRYVSLHKTFYLYDDSILQVMDINFITGDISYPVFDQLIRLVDIGISICFNLKSLFMHDLIVNTYGLDVYKIVSKKDRYISGAGYIREYYWVVNKFNGRLPNFKLIPTHKNIDIVKVVIDGYYNKVSVPTFNGIKDFLHIHGYSLDSDKILYVVNELIQMGKTVVIEADDYNKYYSYIDTDKYDITLYYIELPNKSRDNSSSNLDTHKIYLYNPNGSINLDSLERTAIKFDRIK